MMDQGAKANNEAIWRICGRVELGSKRNEPKKRDTGLLFKRIYGHSQDI
jgi:hypothetical protein